MTEHSRRDFLKKGAAAAVLYSRGVSAFAQMSHADSPGHTAGKLFPFPLGSVRLGPGVFKEQAEINARYLDSLSVDRLVHSFRVTAGISSRAIPYGGWEDPTCELRGHFAGGHFLSALALASAASGNSVFKSRGDELVSALARCQQNIGSGYLSAFPADLFEHLVSGKPVWAPFYTYHKIMAGLLDMHLLAGNSDALRIVEGMARWAGDYFGGISAEQRQRMLRTEYGGMNEVLVNLAAVTQKERYLDIARLFEQQSLLDLLAERRDELQGLHANTQIPKIIGAARTYEVSGDRRYTGAEEFAKFTDTIFFHRGGDLYVNQFIASSLDWKDEGLTVEQVTQFPLEQGTTLKVKSSRPVPRAIHVRIPGWTAGAAEVRINGRLLEAVADPGSYISVHRVWRDGDTITVHLPMELGEEALAGDDSVTAFLYGPLVLAADLGAGPADGPNRVIHGRATAPENIPPPAPLPRGPGKLAVSGVPWIELESKADLRFKAAAGDGEYRVMPMYRIRDQRYSIYWQAQLPKQRD